MAFYEDVNENDPFAPSARLSNDIRHLLNSFGDVGARNNAKMPMPRAISIEYINTSSAVISAGAPVEISGGNGNDIYGAAFGTATVKWGVNAADTDPGMGGMAVTGGFAMVHGVTGSASTHAYLKPDGNGYQWADDGVPVIWNGGTAGVLVYMDELTGGYFSIGASVDKAFQKSGNAIEAHFMADTSSSHVATAAFGNMVRLSGDTAAKRPVVTQREMALKTPDGNGIFYAAYASAETSTAVALESEMPPQASGENKGYISYIDGAKFNANSVAVQRFATFNASTSEPIGLPFMSQGPGEMLVDFARGGGTAGFVTYDNQSKQVKFADCGTDSFAASWHGAPKFYEVYDALNYGQQLPYWNGNDFDYIVGSEAATCGDCFVTYDGNMVIQVNGLSFSTTTDDADHVVVKRADGKIKSEVWHPSSGRVGLPYWDSYGNFTSQQFGSDDIDQLVIVKRNGTYETVTGGSTAGKYKLQMSNGLISWVSDN